MTVCYWCGAKDTLADVGKELNDGKYKMVQCQKCKNAYYVVNKEKMNKPKPMTNEEWFCNLSTEEKAEFSMRVFLNCTWCLDGGNPKECPFNEFSEHCPAESKENMMKWLKEIHE